MKLISLVSLMFISISSHAIDDTRLFLAIDSDNVGIVKKAVESGEITVDKKIRTEPYSSAPLITIAGRSASLSVLKYLIANKADLNARTSAGETAIMLASFFDDTLGDPNLGYARHEKAVKLLGEAGADLENTPDQFVPLAYAAYSAHTKIMSYLLAKGANPNGNAIDGYSKVNTPLMMSALAGSLQGTLIILRANADAKIVNTKDMTALMMAKNNNKRDMIPYLECAEELKPGEIFKTKCE